VTSILALVRLRNLLLSAAGVAIGGVLAQGSVRFPVPLLLAILSGVLLGAAGNVANDIFDREADRIDKPERPLVSGRVSERAAFLLGGLAGGLGLLAAYFVSARLLWLAVAALGVMLVYSPLLKPAGLPGNLAVATIGSLPPVYGALALGAPRAGLVPFAIATLLHFARELVKDVEDMPGDRALGRRTVPLRWGRDTAFVMASAALIMFVPASLAPWFAGWYGARYGFSVLALNLLIALLISRLLAKNGQGTPGLAKLAMAWGILAVLWDRL